MKKLITITDKDITGIEKRSSAKPRIAVGVVLFDADNHIALSYIANWDEYLLPGGGVDDGEDFLAAAKREMWEETGCKCEIIGEIGVTCENRGEEDFVQEKSFYIAKVVGEKGELHLEDYEIASGTTVKWYTMEEAVQILLEQNCEGKYGLKFCKRRDVAVLSEVMALKFDRV